MILRSGHSFPRWALVGLAGFLTFCWVLAGHAADKSPEPRSPTAPPQFSVQGGVFTNDLVVSLSSGSSSTTLRYTVDGSAPTAKSPAYSRPIQITNSAVIKAAAFEADAMLGDPVSQTYILLDKDLANFSSNLPLVIVNTFGQAIRHEQKSPAFTRFIAARTNRTTLLDAADFDGSGDINVRGYTSLRYAKHSYHFKSKDDAHRPLKTAIFGIPKDSDWILYAPFPDKTLMRDVLAYELSNQLGRYAPRTRFVEVFVNEARRKLSLRDYVGVYVFEDKIKRGSNRVNVEKLEPGDNTEPQITGGYIFKKDHSEPVDLNPNGGGGSHSGSGFMSGPGGFPANPDGFFQEQGGMPYMSEGVFNGRSRGFRNGLLTSRGSQFFYVEPKADEISAPQKAWLSRYLNAFENSLYSPRFADAKSGYAAYIDADSFIDYHLLVETTKNIDGFRFSTFYYKDRGGLLKMGPLWDWNLSLGNANGKQGAMPERWYWPQLDDFQYSWFRRLFEDPDFAQKYVDRWGELRTNQFAVSTMMGRIDRWAAELNEAQERNFKRWRILGRQVWPNSYVGQTFQDEVSWMKVWLQTRLTWMDKQFLAAPLIGPKAGAISKDAAVSLQARAGRILFTLDGSDPRMPGGRVSPKAQLYKSPLKLETNAVVFARALQGRHWSYPAISTLTVASVPATATP